MPESHEIKLDGNRLIMFIDGKEQKTLVNGTLTQLYYWLRGALEISKIYNEYVSVYARYKEIK